MFPLFWPAKDVQRMQELINGTITLAVVIEKSIDLLQDLFLIPGIFAPFLLEVAVGVGISTRIQRR